MYLVNDVNSVFKCRGSIYHFVANVSDIINAVVGCRVHFKNVGSRACIDSKAGGALITRTAVDRSLAVDSLRENLRAGGLTRSARAAEKVGVRELIVLGLIFKYRGNVLLTANVVKGLRAPFTV